MYDLVIKNGTVVDGTGAPSFVGDVAIADGLISLVGSGIGAARRTIDATGLLVTPGFIDAHTHYDAHVLWDSDCLPTVWHGTSTIVIGNCGIGFAPMRPGDQARLIDLMASVEDVPAACLEAALTWNWETYPEYLDAVAERPRRVDVCSMITHSPLRFYVMGDHAHASPSAIELEQMCQLVREGMRAGAVGLSTSRTILHTTGDGVPVPGTTADEAELTALARAVLEGGEGVRGVLELSPAGIAADEPVRLLEDVDRCIRIARKSRCPVMFSLVQSNFRPQEYREALNRVAAARREGVGIIAQVFSRPISALLGFQGTFNPFAHLPSYAPLLSMSLGDRVAALRDPAMRRTLLAEEVAEVSGMALIYSAPGVWNDIFRTGRTINHYPRAEDSIAAIAEKTGSDPKEVAYEAMLENDGHSFLVYALANWANRNHTPLHEMVTEPGTLIGLADAGAHLTAIVDFSQPTTFLRDWVRDRAADDPEGISIEMAVHKLSRANAAAFGLHDRGAIRPGLKADLNVIDLASLDVTDPEMVYDLPAGRPRLDQRSRGYVATIVSGQVVVENGVLTESLPGGVVRGALAAVLRAA